MVVVHRRMDRSEAPWFVTTGMTVALLLVSAPRGHADQQFALVRPVNCELGKSCFIQNYVDHDSSEKSLDFQCGHRTYNGHDGTDIRIPDIEAQKIGVEVLAAAGGNVTHVRDGMDDVSVHTARRNSIAGKECGNGVLIDHEQGWSTQYCHLAKGSLRVRPGEQVQAGQTLGLIGLSGNTEFPHLHFTVRQNRSVVDPFAYEAPQNSCNSGHPIWTPSALAEMRYVPREIINFGFAEAPATMDMIETGEIKRHVVSFRSDVLVAYVRAIGLEMGDEQALEVRLPEGRLLAESRLPALEQDKAQMFVSAGRRLKGVRWPGGTYKATYVVTRNGIEVLRKAFETRISE